MANVVRILLTAKDDVSGALDKVHDKAVLLSKTDIGKGMATGAGIAAFNAMKGAALGALDAAVQWGVGSIRAASDQREAIALTQQVFESSTDSVKDWARNTKDAFSSTEALNFASQFGTAFKSVGMSLDEVTDKAQTMTTLAGDLGSAFNTSSEEAAQALKSGLLGESEPMRRFGVFLSEAAVKSKAAAMGMKAVGGALSDSQKVAARYQIILEQTIDSQGMFGRDSESLADKQKLLDSSIEDLSVRVGNFAVGPVTAATEALTTMTDAVIAVDEASKDLGIDLGIVGEAASVNIVTLLTDTLNPIKHLEAAFNDTGDAAVDSATRTAESWDTGSERVGMALDEVHDKAGSTRNRMRRLGDTVHDTAGDFKDLTKWAGNAGDALAEASYGPEELELAFEGARLELKDNQSEVERLQDKFDKLEKEGKKAPRSLKREMNEAEQAVNESKQEVIRLGTKLHVTGGISMNDLRRQFSSLGVRIDTTSDKAADLWWYLKHISNVNLGTIYDNTRGGIGGRAAGGFIPPYGTSVVGENRAELITVGSSGAYVNPSAAGAAGSGGSVVVNLTVSTPLMTPGSSQALAQEIIPIIARELQRRQLIGAR